MASATPKLLVVGAGRMGSALLGGLLLSGWASASEISVCDPDPAARQRLSDAHPDLVVLASPARADGAVLAVKPEVAESALAGVKAAGVHRVLSIVAGLGTARLEAALAPGDVVIRAMPNSPSLIGCGVAAMSGGATATAADVDWAEGILGALGVVVRLPERHLDAVTGLSGSGPAYIYLVAEALVEAGVAAGISHDVSRQLVVETMAGAARMMQESGADPAELRAQVTSPGGTTTAGLRSLEFKAVRSAFIEAVAAATERSRQLGR